MKISGPTGSAWWQLLIAFVAGAALAGVSLVEVVHPDNSSVPKLLTVQGGAPAGNDAGTTADTGPAGSDIPAPGTSAGTGKTTTTTGGSSGAAGGGGGAAAGTSCSGGQNGGSTDQGVTGNSIKLATTVVQSGVGAAFLGEIQYAMEAVRNKVNRAGGICGRQLQVSYIDDGWQAADGARDLRSFLNQDHVFAIPVGPSSEGLRVVIDGKDIDKAQVPVVGSDGMLIDQYQDPWVWPVATSTASSARIMAYDAYKRGARKFSIVFDQNYHFGTEAATAFENEVMALTHQPIDGYSDYQSSAGGCHQAFCGVIANSASYNNEVSTVGNDLGDFMAMFLEPATALQWMATTGAPTPTGINNSPKPRLSSGPIGAGQPLFTYNFGVNCKEQCDQMWVWTGYKPNIPDFGSDAAVQQFASDLQGTKPDADSQNAFTEGGYLGMELLVKALQQVGPNLTRANLKTVLDSTDFASGLTIQDSNSWRPGNHFASTTMESFAMQYKGTFGGWRPVTADITQDPNPRAGTG